MTLARVAGVLLALGAAAARGVVELHAASFHALLTAEEERDALVVFYFDGAAACAASRACAAALAVADDVAGRVGPAVAVAVYDVAAHGLPAGVHVHGSPAVVLIAAGDRGSYEYEWWHDGANRVEDGGGIDGGGDGRNDGGAAARGATTPASAASAPPPAGARRGGGDGAARAGTASSRVDATVDAAADDDHEHAHDGTCSHAHGGHHAHAGDADDAHAPPLVPRVSAVLAWLRRRTTFPSDVPAPTLADTWRGREDGVVRAIADGLEALRQIVHELQAENAQLRRRLHAAERAAGRGGAETAGGAHGRAGAASGEL